MPKEWNQASFVVQMARLANNHTALFHLNLLLSCFLNQGRWKLNKADDVDFSSQSQAQSVWRKAYLGETAIAKRLAHSCAKWTSTKPNCIGPEFEHGLDGSGR